MSEPQPSDPQLAKLYERVGTKIKAAAPLPDPLPPASKIIQLPLWSEPLRGTPNSFLRSALFAAIQGKTRRWMKKEFLGSLQGMSVSFTGQQLDQSDLDVWEQAVHLARLEPLGNTCQFTGYAFLKALGRSVGKGDYKWLDDAFTRLVACAVEVRNGPLVFTGSLLSSCERDETNGVYSLTLDPKTIRLYHSTNWTALDWEQRSALRGKALALWLHGFYSSHARPHPIKIETLHRLSGSGTHRLRKFKENLKVALADLEEATGIKGIIEGDLVAVERLPSPTQQRHLTRRSKQGGNTRKRCHQGQTWPLLEGF
jgi:hypothetical protein